MRIAHDGHARSDFPSRASVGQDGRMPVTAPPARLMVPRVAALQLRSRTGVLAVDVAWPAPAEQAPALLIFFPDATQPDRFSDALARAAGAVALTATLRSAPYDLASTVLDDASVVLGWAADHADELDADPERLIVAGHGGGAALAAAVALHARDAWWPAISRQVLIHPDLDAWEASVPHASTLREAPLAGAAPATVVTGAGTDDDGRCLAARLSAAGVEVEELQHDGAPDAELFARLAYTLTA
jgi:acetyl esterase/lipase